MSRTDVRVVEIGQLDPMSVAALRAGVPLCRQPKPSSGIVCTRAKGHNDRMADHSKSHPASLHVAAGTNGIASAVWS